MHVELTYVEMVIKQDIEAGANQKYVALTYALGLASGYPTDWGVVNRMIVERWSYAGLQRVKNMAWKMVADKRTEGNTPS